MTTDEAARILAEYILFKAKSRGVDDVDDEFCLDMIAEATWLPDSKWSPAAQAALMGAPLETVRREVKALHLKAL